MQKESKSVKKATLNAHNIPINNLTEFSSDNAAVMIGNQAGVQARFKEINPNIFVMECVCHGMCIFCSYKVTKQIEDLIRDVYSFC